MGHGNGNVLETLAYVQCYTSIRDFISVSWYFVFVIQKLSSRLNRKCIFDNICLIQVFMHLKLYKRNINKDRKKPLLEFACALIVIVFRKLS